MLHPPSNSKNYADTEKVKSALTQSAGVVATTRYSLEWPGTGSTFRSDSFIRQAIVGLFVAKPVSCPMVADVSGGALPDHGVSVTFWPLRSPEY